MLEITFTEGDEAIAYRIRDDVQASNIRVDEPISIVLISAAALEDSNVSAAIRKALAQNHKIVPVLLEDMNLPESLRDLNVLDLSDGYKANQVLGAVRRANIGDTVLQSNQRILFYLGSMIVLVFAISIGALATGIVGFPEEEFANEAATREAQIQTLTFPTLDAYMPRSTEDALDFPLTVEAASTRNAPLLAASATALPQNLRSTENARATAIVETSTARAPQPTAE